MARRHARRAAQQLDRRRSPAGRRGPGTSTTQPWYLHLFLAGAARPQLGQPRRRAPRCTTTLRFWLDRGVDGFRIDVVHLIGKDAGPPRRSRRRGDGTSSRSTTARDARAPPRDPRACSTSYPGDRMSVGEVYLLDPARVATLLRRRRRAAPVVQLPAAVQPWDAGALAPPHRPGRRRARPRGHGPRGCCPTTTTRATAPATAVEARARAAAVLLLTLRGTPFLYAGEELGLEDAVIPPDRVVDPGRSRRVPRPDPVDGSDHGWPRRRPWLPWPPEPERRNAAALRDDPPSIVHLYRRILVARPGSDALRIGAWAPLGSPWVSWPTSASPRPIAAPCRELHVGGDRTARRGRLVDRGRERQRRRRSRLSRQARPRPGRRVAPVLNTGAKMLP